MNYKKIKRLIAGFLAVFAILSGIASLLIIGWNGLFDSYQTSYDEVLKSAQYYLQRMYNTQIYEDYQEYKREFDKTGNTYDTWRIDNSNMEYGFIVVKDDTEISLEDINFYDETNYTYSTFKETVPSKNSVIMRFSSSQVFHYSINVLTSMYDAIQIWENLTWQQEFVHCICYDKEREIFLYETDSGYYPVRCLTIETDLEESDAILAEYTESDKTGKGHYVINNSKSDELHISDYKNWTALYFDGFLYDEINIVEYDNIEDENIFSVYDRYAIIGNGEYEKLAIETIHVFGENEVIDNSNVYLVSNVKEVLDSDSDDYFYEQEQIVRVLYDLRYVAIIMVIASVIIFFASMYVCGKNTILLARENEKQPFLHKIPLELYLILLVVAGACVLSLGIMFFQDINDMRAWFSGLWYTIMIAAVVLLITIFVYVIMHIVYRAALGKKKFIYYTFCHMFVRMIKRILKKIRKLYVKIRSHFSLIAWSGIVVFCITIIEFLIMAFLYSFSNSNVIIYSETYFIWLIIKVLEYILTVIVLIQMKHLLEGGKYLAEGNLNYTIDTKKMFWDFKRHGENLNQIQKGMNIALNEKIKSERFKTELITNVSHDIKTPLTSIINYVDLMQKEEIAEPKVKEYLEILQRQSKRLKKLTEDLVEASKASTGNLEVNLTECDMDILLTQTVGEFEEKLAAQDLQLIVQQLETPVKIMADNRHLWRVFDNLMNNICKYSQPQTRVYINQEIITDETGQYVAIIFKNTSKYPLNMSSEELFERFVRGDASRHTEGSGLGLSIAQNLVNLMDGKMELYIDGDLFKVVIKFIIGE